LQEVLLSAGTDFSFRPVSNRLLTSKHLSERTPVYLKLPCSQVIDKMLSALLAVTPYFWKKPDESWIILLITPTRYLLSNKESVFRQAFEEWAA